jgi:hypothetical protein
MLEAIARVLCLFVVALVVAVLLPARVGSECPENPRRRRQYWVWNWLLALFGVALLVPVWHSSDWLATYLGFIGGIVGSSVGRRRLTWMLFYGILGSVIGAWVGVVVSLSHPYNSAYAAMPLREWSICATIQGLILGVAVSGGANVGWQILRRSSGTAGRH